METVNFNFLTPKGGPRVIRRLEALVTSETHNGPPFHDSWVFVSKLAQNEDLCIFLDDYANLSWQPDPIPPISSMQ